VTFVMQLGTFLVEIQSSGYLLWKILMAMAPVMMYSP
jgi:hypothetical protein